MQFVRDDEAFGEGRISDDEIDDTFEAAEAASRDTSSDDEF